MSYQTSSKRSPPFWLLIGARIGAPTICPTISEDANRLNSLNNGAMGGGGVGGRLYTGNYTALFVYNLVIGYSKRREKIIRLKAFDKKKKIPGLKSNQVLGTVLQCSYFSVISRFPLKTVQRYQNFLAVLPPHSIRSWNSGKNSGYPRPTLFVGWGKGLDLCVPMMIVWKRGGKKKAILSWGFQACKSVVSGFWLERS